MQLLTILFLTCYGSTIVLCESPIEIGPPMPECTDGENKAADDGCNTCTCLNGYWACTLKACPGKVPESESLELPNCKSSGGKCMKKRKELNCQGIINRDYECSRGRSCCLRAFVRPAIVSALGSSEGVADSHDTFVRPAIVRACAPTQCPQDCATITIRDPKTGCETCLCGPKFTNPLVRPPIVSRGM